MKLSAKLLLTYLGIASVLAPAIGVYTHGRVTAERFGTIQRSIASQLVQVDTTVTDFMEGVTQDLRTIADTPVVRTSDASNFTSFVAADPAHFEYAIGPTEQRIIEAFQTYRKHHPYVSSVYMGRSNGSFVRSHPRTHPTRYDPRDRPWYQLAVSSPGRVLRTQPYRSVTSKDINIGTVVALVDASGEPFGVVGIDVTLRNLAEYVAQLRVGERGFVFLLDSEHAVLTAPGEEPGLDRVLRTAAAGLTEDQRSAGVVSLESGYLFLRHSERLGWTIGALLPREDIDGRVRQAVTQSVLWVLISLLAATLLGALIVQRLVLRPIGTLEAQIRSIVEAGDLGRTLGLSQSDEIGSVARAFDAMLGRLKRSLANAVRLERANAHLGRYFSPAVADRIRRADERFFRPGGQVQNVAVLFCDVRNFTTLSEQVGTDALLRFLSVFHMLMVEIIFRHGGTLDKFIGDGIMATFGTPEPSPTAAEDAVHAAVDMQAAHAELLDRIRPLGIPDVAYGIGIHYGPAIVGNVGSPDRLEFTVIGDTVNVAARIESACKPLGERLLVSRAVHDQLGEVVRTRPLGEVELKGKSEALEVFAVDGWG